VSKPRGDFKQLAVWVDVALYEDLTDYSARHGKPVADVVRDTLQDLVDAEEPEPAAARAG
jgi:hypothetical protein